MDYSSEKGGTVDITGTFAASITPNYEDYWKSEAPWVYNQSISWGLPNLGYFQSFKAPREVENAEKGWSHYTAYDADEADIVLEQVRQSMFIASLYSGSQRYTDNDMPVQQFI